MHTQCRLGLVLMKQKGFRAAWMRRTLKAQQHAAAISKPDDLRSCRHSVRKRDLDQGKVPLKGPRIWDITSANGCICYANNGQSDQVVETECAWKYSYGHGQISNLKMLSVH